MANGEVVNLWPNQKKTVSLRELRSLILETSKNRCLTKQETLFLYTKDQLLRRLKHLSTGKVPQFKYFPIELQELVNPMGFRHWRGPRYEKLDFKLAYEQCAVFFQENGFDVKVTLKLNPKDKHRERDAILKIQILGVK